MVKSICSSRGPGLDSQHPHIGSQLSVTPVSRLASEGITCMCYTDIHVGKTSVNIKRNNKIKLQCEEGAEQGGFEVTRKESSELSVSLFPVTVINTLLKAT